MSETMAHPTSDGSGRPEWPVAFPVEYGRRAVHGGWTQESCGPTSPVVATPLEGGGVRLELEQTDADAVSLSFAVTPGFQAFGGGARFDALDLSGQTIRYYLENFGLKNGGTYLPAPWIATSLGWSIFLPGEDAAIFHIGAPHDPYRLTVQVEGPRLELELHPGDLPGQYTRLIDRIGPSIMPEPAFFSLWKAGDWRFQDSGTVAADVAGFADLELPLGVVLLDAYWASEVMSFRFDSEKHSQAQEMIDNLKAAGSELHLWLCPWVVVGTTSHAMAQEQGYLIADAQGAPITRRPGANPNTVAALIDYSNPQAAEWWANGLRSLLAMGVAGFKADFGEQLPEHAMLHSGETGGQAHNAFVRHYLDATAAAFDGRTPAIISRSGAQRVRTQIWTGDQTSDFCPKTGLPGAIRAVQSVSLSGWSFVGTDLGGYFGTPTPQVFARWAQFAAFCPLMMLHGLGCREPWDMPPESAQVYRRYSLLHLALGPEFERLGRIAADGGLPPVRMMPLAFPEHDWRDKNDWDQQFMLGSDLLVAPVAFYGNTRAVWVPAGHWFDVLAQDWIKGPVLQVHDVAPDDVPLFVREGAELILRPEPAGETIVLRVARTAASPGDQWAATLGTGTGGVPGNDVSGVGAPNPEWMSQWFGPDLIWTAPHAPEG